MIFIVKYKNKREIRQIHSGALGQYSENSIHEFGFTLNAFKKGLSFW